MNPIRVGVLLTALVVALSFSGCGGSSRRLVSISISPDPGVAKNQKVQLVATGTFNEAPTLVTPLEANWQPNHCNSNVCPQAIVAQPVTVSSSGLATCQTGYSGSVVILLTAPADPSRPVDSTTGTLVDGKTTVTCP